MVELFDSGESLQGVDKNPSAHPPPHTTHNDVETREYEGAHQCSDDNTSHQEAQKTSEYCNISVTKIENKLDEQEPENAKFVTESLSSQLESEGLSFHTSVSSPKQAGSTEVSNLGSPSAEIVSREIKVNSSVGLERNDDSYDAMLPATPLNGPSSTEWVMGGRSLLCALGDLNNHLAHGAARNAKCTPNGACAPRRATARLTR